MRSGPASLGSVESYSASNRTTIPGSHTHDDQEFTAAAGRDVVVTFTPHLVPMNRGILSTIHVRCLGGKSPEDLHAVLTSFYGQEPFLHVLPFGEMPQTRHVRGSNMT